ncbi:MAG: GNAT family N-acetyltransferase [Bacteroidales bacterium]|nr:GNAT family N-acetyltransferase [Bacteroidales bacterium]MDD4669547.1 GNAT family N-acetyltransferase [Bacteroidales bacterium]
MNIEFKPIYNECEVFRNDVRRVLSIAVNETFGDFEDESANPEEVIADADIDMTMQQPSEEVYFIEIDKVRVGAIALNINTESDGGCRGKLDLFIIYPEYHSKGYGTKIIQAIEQKYPEVRVWELITPYFEKRNIHFYVNKCGYKIVEFFNAKHIDKAYSERRGDMRSFEKEYFRFEKEV